MRKYKTLLVVAGFLLLCSSIPLSTASNDELESSSCLAVYEQGGAPAVFHSPQCPNWNLSKTETYRNQIGENCKVYRLQGRRNYQEDRTVCELDLHIAFPGGTGVKEVTVGMVGVFDGHNGAEASEMASKLILDYFLLHVHFLHHGTLENSMGKLHHEGDEGSISDVLNGFANHKEHGLDLRRYRWEFPEIVDGSFHMEVLKESLLRAIQDIDAKFSEEAHRNDIAAGSTAAVVLIVDNQMLVSNVGDSKAILCSETFKTPQDIKDAKLKFYKQRRSHGGSSSVKRFQTGKKHFSVKELTRDHHPDRDDERSRIESSGGFVEEWSGVPRVNGQLAVSRSIGDIPFKRYGVVSTPEVTEWQLLSSNDTYLVAASDGIFEKMTTKDVCDLLWDVHEGKPEVVSSCISSSLAECIVNAAFESGSMDNMAAIVVPLKSPEEAILTALDGDIDVKEEF
ncbi:protein-serine/threonine phosphatase [Ranunculus cassubicifolius]